MNIQQQTTSEVADTEIVVDDDEELDPPPPQDISNVFAAADLLSQSSYDQLNISVRLEFPQKINRRTNYYRPGPRTFIFN